MTAATCENCQRTRTETDPDYNPIQIIANLDLGWYSGTDAELCGECMTTLMNGANKR